jgi:hypothetical protein
LLIAISNFMILRKVQLIFISHRFICDHICLRDIFLIGKSFTCGIMLVLHMIFFDIILVIFFRFSS